MGNLFEELKRRKVFRVAAAYSIVAWLLIQIVDVVLPYFNAPQWAYQTIVLVLILGIPVVVVLAWAFDITPEGIRKTEALGPGETTTIRKRDYLVSALVLLLVGVVVTQQFVIFNRPIGDESITSQEDVVAIPSRVEEAVAPTTPIADNSIAVLVLRNESPDPNNEYFAAGIHEEILNQLAKISAMRVKSRTTVLRYLNR